MNSRTSLLRHAPARAALPLLLTLLSLPAPAAPAWNVSSESGVIPGWGTVYEHRVQNLSPNIADNNLIIYTVPVGLDDGVIQGTGYAGSGSWQITYAAHSVTFQAIDGTYISPNGGETSFGFMVSHFRAPAVGHVSAVGRGSGYGTLDFPPAGALLPGPRLEVAGIRARASGGAAQVELEVLTRRHEIYAPGLACTVLATTDLRSGVWLPAADNAALTGAVTRVTLTNGPPARFFRLAD